MKRLFSTLLCLCLLLCLAAPALAAQTLPLIIDGAQLLTDQAHRDLLEQAASLKSRYAMDVVILTTPSLAGMTPQEYADNYYDSNGYSTDGLLFLLSMEERDWYLSTSGNAIYALTDYGIQTLMEGVLPYLSDGAYEQGFSLLLDSLPEYFDAYASGHIIDGQASTSNSDAYYHGEQEYVVHVRPKSTFGAPDVLIALTVGLITALIVVVFLWRSMNTKRPQRSAANYLVPGSYLPGVQRDIFLYSHVDRRRKPDPPSNHGGGGGSSIHTSAGGTQHGGGGGKF